MNANHPVAANPALAVRFQIVSRWRGVAGPHRSGGTSKTRSIFARAAANRQFSRLQLLVCTLMAGAVLAGCRTPLQEESFSNSFDAQRVAQLAHEAYKVAFDATFWARHDLRFAAFQP